MSIVETGASFQMKQGSMVDSIFVPKVQTGEISSILGALEKTALMKCKGYTQTFENDTYTGNYFYALPTPPAQIFRRKIVTFKLTNAAGQNIFVRGDLPYNIVDTGNYQTMADAFVTKTLSFGKVESCTWDING
ncbi:hypothetical protein NRK67_02510 [Fusobacteria bacterium ZRK30]|nr:hypothetical protein NRK67_02510 [Fusobacteria bacterium ZRK30]